MITEIDLQEAIAECQGQRNPNANTCIKLAAFLTIQRELFGNPERLESPPLLPEYSFAAMPSNTVENTVYIESDSDFARAANGKDERQVWAIIDELMTALQVVNPRLYAGVMRKIEE